VLTPQHYLWYAATRFALPGGSQLSELQQSTNWIVQWTLRQWSTLAEGCCTKMWKYAVLRFEPMTYGSESECATRYTTAPTNYVVLSQRPLGSLHQTSREDVWWTGIKRYFSDFRIFVVGRLGEFNSLNGPNILHKNVQQKNSSGLLSPSWTHTVLNLASQTFAIHQ